MKKKIFGIIFSVIFSFCILTPVLASDFSKPSVFGTRTDVFSDIDNSTNFVAGVTDGKSASNVGIDVLYGAVKNLVSYRGEIPKALAIGTNSEFTKYYYTDYHIDWPDEAINVKKVSDLQTYAESVKDDVATYPSLRLYASLTASNAFATSVHAFFVSAMLLGINLSKMLLTFVLQIKNFNLTALFTSLHYESLEKVMTTLFISSNGAMSPYLLFCLAGGIISIAFLGIEFLRKSSGWVNLGRTMLYDLLALGLVGICFLSGTSSISESLAKFGDSVSSQIATSIDNDSKVFTTTLTNRASESNYYNDLSLVNKILINTTIEKQFNVSNISDLDFKGPLFNHGLESSNLNITDSESSLVADNLGYYYWFADSPAASLSNNSNLIETGRPEAKIEEIFNYLQENYDAATDTGTKAQIRNMMKGFANPDNGGYFLDIGLITIVYILLTIALFKLAVQILFAKLKLLLGTLFIPVAGPLFLINNEKIRGYGKLILSAIIFSTIELIIYGLIFEVILQFSLYLSSSATVLMLFLTILFLVGLVVKVLPRVSKQVDNLIASLSRNFAPEYSEAMQKVTQPISSFTNKHLDNVQNKAINTAFTKYSVDSQGNEITELKGDTTSDKVASGIGLTTANSVVNAMRGKTLHNSDTSTFNKLTGKSQDGLTDFNTKVAYSASEFRGAIKARETAKEELESLNARKKSEIDSTVLDKFYNSDNPNAIRDSRGNLVLDNLNNMNTEAVEKAGYLTDFTQIRMLEQDAETNERNIRAFNKEHADNVLSEAEQNQLNSFIKSRNTMSDAHNKKVRDLQNNLKLDASKGVNTKYQEQTEIANKKVADTAQLADIVKQKVVNQYHSALPVQKKKTKDTIMKSVSSKDSIAAKELTESLETHAVETGKISTKPKITVNHELKTEIPSNIVQKPVVKDVSKDVSKDVVKDVTKDTKSGIIKEKPIEDVVKADISEEIPVIKRGENDDKTIK